MPSLHQWEAFLVASFLFIQLPGPSLLFTIGRALSVGRQQALMSVVGNGLGLLTQVVAVGLGLGALVAASATAYTVVKLVGSAYVIHLGIQAIRRRAAGQEAVTSGPDAPRTRGHGLRIGFLVGLTNPKTIVFFVAFLPQFTNASQGHLGVQMAVLGLVFCTMAVCSDSAWALVALRARAWFAGDPHRLERLSAIGGTMMVGLGVTMLVRD